jgi:hypothetical protein
MSIFSQMSYKSGTTTVIGLNNAFNPYGSYARPRYPGFMVMNTPQVLSREISSPWRMNRFLFYFIASVTLLNWTEQTERTSGRSLLNSSKQPQQPDEAKPL